MDPAGVQDGAEEDTTARAGGAHRVGRVTHEARPDHHVGAPLPDRLEEVGDAGRVVLAVRVELHDPTVPAAPGILVARLQGRAVAEVDAVGRDRGAVSQRADGRVVARSIINDQDLRVGHRRTHGIKHAPDPGRLIEGGNDHQSGRTLRGGRAPLGTRPERLTSLHARARRGLPEGRANHKRNASPRRSAFRTSRSAAAVVRQPPGRGRICDTGESSASWATTAAGGPSAAAAAARTGAPRWRRGGSAH